MRLKDKVAIRTGAAQGIGLASALKFARRGVSVAAVKQHFGCIDLPGNHAGFAHDVWAHKMTPPPVDAVIDMPSGMAV